MRVAIYARRSTEEHQAASLELQISEAKRYIDSKGWALAEQHIYADDAKSRAEFKKRPGLIAMINAAESGAFDAVVIRDESRLGGDMHRTGLVLQDLVEHGIRIFYFFDDEEVSLTGAVDKILIAVRSFASELEREKIAGRTREHLQSKARRGLNTGGKCFGYDNVPIFESGKRVAVDYKINEAEAAIVREIFERYAAGDGLRSIAKDLNARGIPSPRGTGSWSPARIREMVHRERYVGILVWGKAKKAYRGGTKVRLAQVDADCIKVDRPELRIVPQALWDAVRAKFANRKPWKAGAKGPKPRYLLSGLARCAECGGPLMVSNSKDGKKIIRVYGCAYHRARGDSVCKNTLRRPVSVVDAAVLEWIRDHVIREELIMEVLAEVRRRLSERSKQPNTERADLAAEARKLRAEIDRLVAAIAAGTASPTLGKAIEQREARLSEVNARLDVLSTAPGVIDFEVRRLEKEARTRLADLAGLIERNPTEARKALEAVFTGPLTFTRVNKRYEIKGTAAVGTMFTTEGVPDGISTVLNSPEFGELAKVSLLLTA